MLSAVVFMIGVFGFLIRRNIVMMFMSIELMLNGVNISLLALSHYMQDMRGQVLVFFVIACAAAGVAVGLALMIAAFRNKPTLHMDEMDILKG
jgi:NADH-quinone oxidoreductase subunit K